MDLQRKVDRLISRMEREVQAYKSACCQYDVMKKNLQDEAKKLLAVMKGSSINGFHIMAFAVATGLREEAVEYAASNGLNDREIGEILGLSTIYIWQIRRKLRLSRLKAA